MIFQQQLPSFKLIEFRDRAEMSSFSRVYNAYAGREGGQRPRYALKKSRLWCIAIFGRGLKINIFNALFW